MIVAQIINRVGGSLDCLKNKNLLITGANGFLCSYFVDVIINGTNLFNLLTDALFTQWIIFLLANKQD